MQRTRLAPVASDRGATVDTTVELAHTPCLPAPHPTPMKLLSTFLVMLLFAIGDAGPMAYSACQATAASVCAAGCIASTVAYPACFAACYGSAQAICAATGIAPTP